MRFFSVSLIVLSLIAVDSVHAASKKRAGKKGVYSIRKAYIDKQIMDIVRKVQREETIKRALEEKAAAEENKKSAAKKYPYGTSEKNDEAPPATASATQTMEPDLEIVFNKRRVNFERPLRHLVTAAEHGKELAHYEVVSEVPVASTGGRRNEIQFGEYQQNINKVVTRMHELGVHETRINIESSSKPELTSQVIKIYQN